MKLIKRESAKGFRFYLQKTVCGKQVQIPLGTDSKAAKTKATRWLSTFEDNGRGDSGYVAAMEQLNGGTPLKRGNSPTLKQITTLYKDYLEQSPRQLKDKTVYDNLKCLGRIMKKTGSTVLADINPQTLRKTMLPNTPTEPQERGFAATVIHAQSIFKKAALDYYETKGFKIMNPFEKVEVHAPKVQAYTPLPQKVIDGIRKDCLELPPCECLIVLLTYEFGLRRGEVEHCKLGWFSEQSDKVYMSVQETDGWKPKNTEKRVIPVSKEVYNEMLAIREKGNPTDDYMSSAGVLWWKRFGNVNAWLKKQGVVSPHPIQSMRKECGSRIAQESGIYQAQLVLGHSSPDVTAKHYANLRNIKTVGGNKPDNNPLEATAKFLGITLEQLKTKLGL